MQPLILLISAGDIQHRRIGGAFLFTENKSAIRCTQQAVGSGNHIEFVICRQLAGVVNDYHRHLIAVGNSLQPGHNIVVTAVADVTAALTQALDVSPKALDVPDIDSYTGLMHTLFTLEDRYGLEVCECEDEVHLRVHIHKGRDAAELHRMLSAWGAVATKLKAGEITKEEYDRWRYRYPELDTSGQWHKITPSQELSDLLIDALKAEQ